jgi:hypothetical protein
MLIHTLKQMTIAHAVSVIVFTSRCSVMVPNNADSHAYVVGDWLPLHNPQFTAPTVDSHLTNSLSEFSLYNLYGARCLATG